MFLETPARERFSNLRVQEAGDLGVEVIATACPFCIACLEDSVKLAQTDLKVMDVAEILAHAASSSLTQEEVQELELWYQSSAPGG